MNAQEGSSGIALLFLQPRHLMQFGGHRHGPATLPPLKRTGTQFTGGWLRPRAYLDECGKSRSYRDWIPDRPARTESLYLLRYTGS